MMFALPILALVVCFCLVVVMCHRQAKRIVDLETALQAQVYAHELEIDQRVQTHVSFDARQVANTVARLALAKQEVL